ncbi:MAG: MarR family winged helix-turn-helix transcriptional regulator [Janthinobacterium lividum]
METSEVPEYLTTSWLCTALMRIGTRLATHFDQHFAEAGITQAQFRALLAVSAADTAGIAPSALAEMLLIERATISVLTNRLVERDLLHRLPGVNRRTFNLALTEDGARLLHQMIPAAVALADEILHNLPLTNLSEMQKSLMSIEMHLRGGTKLDAKGERK